ncbi:hypothetical protein JJL45_03365 [Tamlana sp. s12]|uniref:hypothetical protein n=1 Tax=Tamlana sp. s12 TaxID=1630406 RepID=UPI0008008D15|nr:hypothetical protein [Tamlana sp. s12]OBQ54940.1 hypothetical protein VQ01_09340 [Tamlana sp. s12]QQY83047.1 hypothetical protein JJL45_03365 [Tamlana sp. s12]
MPEWIKSRAHLINYTNIIFSFLLLSLAFDFLDKISIFYDIEIIKLNRYLKIVYLLCSIAFILIHLKYVYDHLKPILGFIIVLTLIFVIKNNLTALYVNEFFRYLFPIISFPLIYYTYKNEKPNLLYRLFLFFKWSVIINAFLIFLGVLFRYKIFKTYDYHRFGYNGFILSQGFTPYFYICVTTVFWVLNKKKLLTLALILAIISGVKGVYFSQFLLLSLLVLLSEKFDVKFKLKTFVFIVILFLAIMIGFFLMPTFNAILNKDGVISAVFSHRSDFALELFHKITGDNYSVLFGATELDKVRLELQLIDIVLFFGIMGLAVYSSMIYMIFKYLIKTNLAYAFFATCLVLSLLSGNLFYIPFSIILVYVSILALRETDFS